MADEVSEHNSPRQQPTTYGDTAYPPYIQPPAQGDNPDGLYAQLLGEEHRRVVSPPGTVRTSGASQSIQSHHQQETPTRVASPAVLWRLLLVCGALLIAVGIGAVVASSREIQPQEMSPGADTPTSTSSPATASPREIQPQEMSPGADTPTSVRSDLELDQQWIALADTQGRNSSYSGALESLGKVRDVVLRDDALAKLADTASGRGSYSYALDATAGMTDQIKRDDALTAIAAKAVSNRAYSYALEALDEVADEAKRRSGLIDLADSAAGSGSYSYAADALCRIDESSC